MLYGSCRGLETDIREFPGCFLLLVRLYLLMGLYIGFVRACLLLAIALRLPWISVSLQRTFLNQDASHFRFKSCNHPISVYTIPGYFHIFLVAALYLLESQLASIVR